MNIRYLGLILLLLGLNYQLNAGKSDRKDQTDKKGQTKSRNDKRDTKDNLATIYNKTLSGRR